MTGGDPGPVLISTRLFVTANSEVCRWITALSPVEITPTIRVNTPKPIAASALLRHLKKHDSKRGP